MVVVVKLMVLVDEYSVVLMIVPVPTVMAMTTVLDKMTVTD